MVDEVDDIGADIQAAMAEMAAAPEPVETTTEVTAEPESDGPARDEHGRFTAKAEAEPKDVAQPDKVVQSVDQPEPVAEPLTEAIQPPHSLKATVKAAWATLSPEVQQELIRIDKAALDGKAEWSSKAEQFNKYEALVSPHRDRLTLAGTNEFNYIQGLIRADEMLRGPNAAQALGQIAQMYGLNIGQIAQPEPQGQVHPVIQTLQQQLATVQEQLAAQTQQQEQAKNQAVLAEIEAFRSDPKHLYFDNVKDTMSALLSSGRAPDLASAYSMACRADEDVWKLIQAPTPVAVPKPKPVQVRGSPAQGSAQQRQANGKDDIEADTRAAFEELTGAV